MKQFENKVLFIKDEEMLKEVEKLILGSGFNIGADYWLCKEDYYNFLYFDNEKDFNVSITVEEDQEITLEQFKELLKQ